MTKSKRREKSNLLIGTSGFSYSHWTKGVFYPKSLKSGEYLAYFSKHFKTVELNVSYYRLPTAQTLQRWYDITPDHFRFAAKLNRQVTHYRKLRNCADALVRNKVIYDNLTDKLGPILAQLPPSLYADHGLLSDFLALLKEPAGQWLGQLALEFRHESWIVDRTYQILDEAGCAICLADWQTCTPTRANDVDFVYLRRHGPHGRYAGCYTKRQLKRDAGLVESCLADGKTVYVYFNNDMHGYAVRNAKQLAEMIEG